MNETSATSVAPRTYEVRTYGCQMVRYAPGG